MPHSRPRLIMTPVVLLMLGTTGCGQAPTAPIPNAFARETATTAGKASLDGRTGEDWSQFLGPNGDGTSNETGVDPTIWKPHPPILWTKQLGVSYGGPTVVGDKLLQFDRYGNKERLTCFGIETGEELWSWEAQVNYDDMYGYNNGPRCSPVVAGEHVYTYGVSGQLSCVQLIDGKEVWTKDVQNEYSVVQNFFGVASTPYVFEDLLLVMVGGSPPESRQLPPGQLDRVKPNGTAVVAFDRMTGAERYRLGNDLASYASMTVREINGKPTGLAFLRSGLLAFDPIAGKELFTFPWRAGMLESVNAALPVTVENQVLLSEAYEVGSVLLEIQDGKPKVVRQDEGRRQDLSFRAHWSTPVVIDGFLYGCSGRNQPDSDFRCVRLSDGEVQWSRRTHERSSVLAVDGYLVVLGEYGLLELVKPNPERFEPVAEVDLNRINDPSDGDPLLSSPCWAAPVLSRGLLYLRGRERLICMELIPATASEQN